MFKQTEQEEKFIDRRSILKAGALGGLLLPLMAGEAKAAAFAMPKLSAHKIAFKNIHTGESFTGAYRAGDRYLPDAFEKINNVLRDFRTGDVFPIDPRVIDIIYMVHAKTGSSEPLNILSGYRSPKTNAMLKRTGGGGVATHSLHLIGQAIDLRIPGFSTRKIRDIGVSLKAGGVGYYPGSDFVHVDTGRVRTW